MLKKNNVHSLHSREIHIDLLPRTQRYLLLLIPPALAMARYVRLHDRVLDLQRVLERAVQLLQLHQQRAHVLADAALVHAVLADLELHCVP